MDNTLMNLFVDVTNRINEITSGNSDTFSAIELKIESLKDQFREIIAQRVKPTEDRLNEVTGDIKAMHGTLEQFEDAIDKRINTDVMLRIENLEQDNQKALGDLQSQIGESISQRMKPSEDEEF